MGVNDEQEWNWARSMQLAELPKTVNKTVASALRKIADEMCTGLPEIWPDSSEEDRQIAYTLTAVASYFSLALTKVADDLESK